MERRRRHQLVLLSSLTGLIIGGVWLVIITKQQPAATINVSASTSPVSRSLIMERRLEALQAQRETGQPQSYGYTSTTIPVEPPR